VARAGKPIPAIFAEQGEAQFRALERRSSPHWRTIPLVAANAASPARGDLDRGGALVDERKLPHAIKRAGVIICLSARPEVIAARVRRSPHKRPKRMEGGKTGRSANH